MSEKGGGREDRKEKEKKTKRRKGEKVNCVEICFERLDARRNMKRVHR